MSEPCAADLRAVEAEPVDLPQARQVRQSAVADVGMREGQPAKFREVFQVSETGVRDVGADELQLAELFRPFQMSQDPIGSCRVVQNEDSQFGSIADPLRQGLV